MTDLFEPDDFADDPYHAGLNQAGHVFAGAFLFSITPASWPLWVAVLVAGAAIVLWEWAQGRFKNATRSDYMWDLIYWAAGLGGWAQMSVSGYSRYAPAVLVLAFCFEYSRTAIKGLND